jgi:fucose permease
VSATFLVMGLTGGIWNARVPAAKSQVHLSDGTLGLALFAVPVGLVLGAALAERLVDRVGSAVLVRICGVGACVVAVTPGLARTLPELMAGLFLIGVFGGTLDVSANAQGVRVEAAYGRPVMTSMHAFFSLGAILGSLAGGAFAALGVTLLPSLAVVGAAGALIDGAAGRWLLSGAGHPRPGTAAPDEPAAPTGHKTAGPGETTGLAARTGLGDLAGLDALPELDEPSVSRPSPGPRRRPAAPGRRQVRRLVLALGVLGICGLVGEGAAGDWSAVYLRDNLGTSAGVAALGFAAFSVTMTLGRGLGDWLIGRFGVVTVIRACGAVATAGVALALVTSIPAVAITGFTAFGAGLSIVVPQVFAAGGRADKDRPGSGLARVVGLGYTGMAAGPAVIGLVADKTGLHLALLIPLVLAAWIAVGARVLRVSSAAGAGNPPRRAPAPAAWDGVRE